MRPFTLDDITPITTFLGNVSRVEQLRSDTHVGDFLHYITNILRGADPSKSVFVDEHAGVITALALMYPYRPSYTLVVHPYQRGGAYERDLLKWCEETRWSWVLRDGQDRHSISTDALDCDPIRAKLLTELGYTIAESPYMVITTRDLTDIPTPNLPDGFQIRAAQDVSEAGALAAVHSGAFGSNWTPEKYAVVMTSAGFTIAHEMVVVAPSGDYAAFLVYWLDPISQTGLFEPVGCHPDYQRRGLIKALMTHTMRLMGEAGMSKAMVKHETDNPASTAAYASLGFRQIAAYHEATKRLV